MRTRKTFQTLALALALLAPGSAGAQLTRRPAPSVFTENLAITVRVEGGVATTTMEQTVVNRTSRPAEATWVLPLPTGAVADRFEMLVNGQPTAGEVLDADRAREVYEGIVRRQLDPGLLEYAGRGCLRARLFPIPPNGETKAKVSFRHVLPRVDGLWSWSLAARAAGVDGRAPRNVTLDLSVTSRHELENSFSPFPEVHVVRTSDRSIQASFEGPGERLPAGDLELWYGLSEADFGLDLLSHREPGEDEGTFLMLLSPKRDWSELSVSRKEIAFVLDTSGSMAGKKLEQALGALRVFLGSLHVEDRFNVVPFSTEAAPFFPEPVVATRENVAKALERAKTLKAVGGTNLGDALLDGLRRSTAGARHVPIVVLLTDGQPTVGVTDADALLAGVEKEDTADTRCFVLGVGNDVNTRLLDSLAERTRGRPDYLAEDEDIELATGALFAKLSNPVLTNLRVEVDGVVLSRTVPRELPDLFQGEQLEVFGRYVGSGARAIRLSGEVQGEPRSFVYEGTFVAAGAARAAALDFLPSLWAERRVGLLLDAIRLNGESRELVDEVERLGREYHIVTPYTSHLIVEDALQVALPAEEPATLRRLRALGYADASDSESGADGFALGAGRPVAPGSSPAARAAEREQLAKAIRHARLLADDADDDEVEELAGEVLDTIRSGRADLAALSDGPVSGAGAVERARYLRRLREHGVTDDEALLGLFTKRVKDKVFALREGRWTDTDFDPERHAVVARVEAFSDEWFALVAERPALAPYLAAGTQLLVVLDREAFEVIPPAAGASTSEN